MWTGGDERKEDVSTINIFIEDNLVPDNDAEKDWDLQDILPSSTKDALSCLQGEVSINK